MYGEKIECAKRAAIMLEKFASAVGIPLMVAGHTTYCWHSGSCELHIYTDFLSAMTDQDRYSLGGIEANESNRDGLALRICCELLAQRTEQVRLLVIISDGAPADTGYFGQEAMKDISDTVKEFRRKGLLIYGAAIDKDAEVIEKIYGEKYLSIQNLKDLPKTLVRLIRSKLD